MVSFYSRLLMIVQPLFVMSELYWCEAAFLGQFVCSIAEKYELFPFGFVN